MSLFRIGDTIDAGGRKFMLASPHSPRILERWRWWSIAVIAVAGVNVILASIVAPSATIVPLLVMVFATGVRWGLVPIRHILREEFQ